MTRLNVWLKGSENRFCVYPDAVVFEKGDENELFAKFTKNEVVLAVVRVADIEYMDVLSVGYERMARR